MWKNICNKKLISEEKLFFNRIFIYLILTNIILVLIFFIFIRFFVSLNTGIPADQLHNTKTIDIQKLREQLKKDKHVLELKKQHELELYLLWLDMETDNSITTFVDNKISFRNKAYVPENLEYIDSQVVYDTKWNSKLRNIANTALQEMAAAFKKDMGRNLTIVSAYRSYAYQAGIKSRGCPDNLCAKAGYSEHQSGLVVDIASASNQATWLNSQNLREIYTWLDTNAHFYWFHNTYQRWVAIDGYEIEPWHWRYLWVEFATYLKKQDLTLAEFYYTREDQKAKNNKF